MRMPDIAARISHNSYIAIGLQQWDTAYPAAALLNGDIAATDAHLCLCSVQRGYAPYIHTPSGTLVAGFGHLNENVLKIDMYLLYLALDKILIFVSFGNS